MRPQKVDNEAMMKGLMSVLRSRGYDGASLKELSEATGLKKASLYHRFPGGKQEMASAVLAYVNKWTTQHISQLLANSELPPKQRLEQALYNIDQLYVGGDVSCIFRALSTEVGLDLFGEQLQQGMQAWIEAFTALGTDFGQSKEEANSNALRSIVDIQGTLVVGKCLSDTSIFERMTEQIRQRYLLSGKKRNF